MMRHIKRIITTALAAAMLLGSATACGGGGETYEIGICRFADHESLSAATEGFREVLTEKLGGKVKITVENAGGDRDAVNSICEGFAGDGVDLIMANATAALTAAANATEEIPVIGVAITDFASALGVASLGETTGRNVSGVSDMIPEADCANTVAELFPSANHSKLGILYCAEEANSDHQATAMKPLFEALGYTVGLYTFKDATELAGAAKIACENSSVLYIPADNVIAEHSDTVKSVVLSRKTPVITADENVCKAFGVATVGIDYAELGRKAGLMAYDVLTGKSEIGETPILYADKTVKKYNPSIAEELGVLVPEGYVAIVE